MASYIVLGIPCGILGTHAGMSVLQIALMSILFFSGAGQYLIANMWLTATPIASIILSVSLVNTRHILYSASLSRFCEKASKRMSALFAVAITDETFGVNLERFDTDSSWNLRQGTIFNFFSQGSWILANIIGAVLGSVLAVPTALASFAMTSIFLCLLFMQKFSKPALAAVVVAAVGVIACKLIGFSEPAIFVGALLGVGAAMLAGKKKEPEGGEAS